MGREQIQNILRVFGMVIWDEGRAGLISAVCRHPFFRLSAKEVSTLTPTLFPSISLNNICSAVPVEVTIINDLRKGNISPNVCRGRIPSS